MLDLYRLLRAPLFRLEAEAAHDLVAGAVRRMLGPGPVRHAVRRTLSVEEPSLRVELCGLDLPNPVGLAAGFDKSGTLFNPLAALGFGFIEIGTVTALPQPGNERPRLFRLPADEALLNRMGFNNPGAEALAAEIAGTSIEPVLGINIGKSKVTPLEGAGADYLRSVDLLQRYASYLVVNVSSPNTPGLRSLQDAEPLRELLGDVLTRVRKNAASAGPACPVFVKLAPDLSDQQVEEAIEIVEELGVDGVVATNTTVSRVGLRTPSREIDSLGLGGISGRPLRSRAEEVVSRIYLRTAGRIPIVGVGGIMNGADAWNRIRAGASAIQIYTGFVYRGPRIVREINREIAARLRTEGLSSIAEAVGLAHR